MPFDLEGPTDPDGPFLSELKFALHLIPFVGEALANYVQDWRDRKAAQQLMFAASAAEYASMSPQELFNQATSSVPLRELLDTAVDAVLRTNYESKIRAVGRALAT